MPSRVILAAVVALASALADHATNAQPYPSRPIKLIVPFPPGGPVDVMGRLVAQQLTDSFGTVIVDNRPGAGGTIGSRGAAAAASDGLHAAVRLVDHARRRAGLVRQHWL